MKSITVQQLKEMMDNKEDFQLIDVREAHEVAISTLNGLHIPMGELPTRMDEVAKDKTVVLQCRSGGRSGAMTSFLTQNGFDNVYNLTGGINAYATEIDPSMPTY